MTTNPLDSWVTKSEPEEALKIYLSMFDMWLNKALELCKTEEDVRRVKRYFKDFYKNLFSMLFKENK